MKRTLEIKIEVETETEGLAMSEIRDALLEIRDKMIPGTVKGYKYHAEEYAYQYTITEE